MEDSQDYVVCTSTSIPSSFEFLPCQNHSNATTSINSDRCVTAIFDGVEDDTLEIFDDHFGCRSSSCCSSRPPSSCEGSDIEDSDIEVVLKSPSSSESASLCSQLSSQLSIISNNSNNANSSNSSNINDTKDAHKAGCCHDNYKNIVFNVHLISGSVGLKETNDDEEDSEVEVIGRSIHCDVQSSDSYVKDVSGAGCMWFQKTSTLTGNKEEKDAEIKTGDLIPVEETVLCNTSESDNRTSSQQQQIQPESQRQQQQEQQQLVHCDDIAVCGSVGVGFSGSGSSNDGVTKYLSQNLHVTRHTTCKGFIGVKTSTVVIIICVSTTLGLYLGNYMGQRWYELYNNEEGVVVVPTHVTSHTGNNDDTDHPLTINITFKYSSTTKQTLKTVLNSFRRLQHDYDRLYAAYQDLKEKTHVKKQMITYWRKQASEKMRDSYVDANEAVPAGNGTAEAASVPPTATVNGNRSCYNPQILKYRKMSTDLREQRKTSFFWKTMYERAVQQRRQQLYQRQQRQQHYHHHQEQKCPKYFPEYFSITKCIENIKRVLPLLDLNLTQPVADNMHRAWNRLRTRWNYGTSYPGPIDPKKVDRFRKIFVIGNVVNSAPAVNVEHDNGTLDEEDVIPNKEAQKSEPDDEEEEEAEEWIEDEYPASNMSIHDNDDDGGEDGELVVSHPLNSIHENEDYDGQVANTSILCSSSALPSPPDEELVWLHQKFKQSTFLVDIINWRNRYWSSKEHGRSTLDFLNRTSVESERMGKLVKYEEQLQVLRRENKELKENLRNTSVCVERFRNKVREAKILMCNNSISSVRRRYRTKYRYLMRKVREEEAMKTKKKMKKAIDQMKMRYDLKLKKVLKSIRGWGRKQGKGRSRQSEKKKKLNRYRREKGTKRYTWKSSNKNDWRERKNYGEENKTNTRPHKPFKRKFRSYGGRYVKPAHHSRGKAERTWKRRDNASGRISRSHTRIYKEKIREYAEKYHRSVVHSVKLRAQFQRVAQERREYKRQVEKYKMVIKQYQDRIQQLLNNDLDSKAPEQPNTETHDQTKTDNHVFYTTKTLPSEKPSVKGSGKVVENEEVNDGVSNIPTGNCYNDPLAKPFYNINDVYPPDLFSKNLNLQAHPRINGQCSDEQPLSFPSTALERQRSVLITPHHVDILTFSENVVEIYGSNSSGIETAFSDVAPIVSGNRIASNNNWYVRLMQEKRKKHVDTGEGREAASKEGFWFWNLMKGRERIRSSEDQLNWFWRAMEGRKEARSSHHDREEINWFWKAMREREDLRTHDDD